MQRLISSLVIIVTSTDVVNVGLNNKETISEDQRIWRKSSFMGGRGEMGEKPKEGNFSLVDGHNLQWMSKHNLYPSFSLLGMATAV